ncbi:neuraminidase-like domain-containing protein [Enterobacter mori]|uniref:Tc toxin subunit A-related protein n=1 Tax=Enterobacter mori TaxID=539813 RepID=UPI001B8AAAB0|nr:neuraminidase-like domain-containing protein [Enterobacter mori]MBS3049633.1 hypothetical protein [Enterobacter mori]
MSRNVDQILNSLAEVKRDAYVDYFVNYVIGDDENTAALNCTSADDLFSYFLSDLQSSAEVETSYVADALASVQQHISNIFNNREPGYSGELSADIQRFWLDYLSHISLWKAYQKLEDFAEDYVPPEYRPDKTTLYRNFDADLGSGYLSEERIELAFLKYLRSYEEVNSIRVLSGYVDYIGAQQDSDTFIGYGFVNSDYYFIGQDNSTPPRYYWRKADIRLDKGSEYVLPQAWQEWKPLEVIEDEQQVLQMRIVKACGRLFAVYLTQQKIEQGQTQRETPENPAAEDDKQYRISLYVSRMGLDQKWDAPELLREEDRTTLTLPDAWNLIAVAFSQAERRDDYLIICLGEQQDENSAIIKCYSLVRDVIKRRMPGVVAEEELGTGWQNSLFTQFFPPNTEPDKAPKEYCQHRITGIAHNVVEVEGKDPYFTLQAVYNRVGSRHQLQVRGVCYRSEKNAELLSLYLQAEIESWSRGRLIVSGQGEYITVRAEALEKPTFAEVFYNTVSLGSISDADFESQDGWFVAEKRITLTAEQRSAIAALSYAEVRAGAEFQYAIQAGGTKQNLKHNSNRVTSVERPVIAPVTLKITSSPGAGLEKDDWDGTLYFQQGITTPWRTYRWDVAAEEAGFVGDVGFSYGLTDEPVAFTIKVAAQAAGLPHVEKQPSGQQFLALDEFTLTLKAVRLNSLQVRDLIYRAQISIGRVFDWEAQTLPELQRDEKTYAALDFFGANGNYLWELFFHLPYLVASRYAQGRFYKEARNWLHYIFSPHAGHRATDSDLTPPPYWNCRVLLTPDMEYSTDKYALPNSYARAYEAPSHYRKAIFQLYLDTLAEEADINYRQLTRDSIRYAWNRYHEALSMLGSVPTERGLPQWQPRRVEEFLSGDNSALQNWPVSDLTVIKPENLPKQLEGFFWLGSQRLEAFRLPVNANLLNRKKIVQQRLFNLRHFLDIEGQRLNIPLYAPALDPFDLLRARLAGAAGLAHLRSDTTMIPPHRFRSMLVKAKELAGTLITLGDKRLQYYEQKERYHAEGIQLKDAKDLAEKSKLIQKALKTQQDETFKALQEAEKMAQQRYDRYADWAAKDVSQKERDALNLRIGGTLFRGAISSAAASAGVISAIPRLSGTVIDTGDKGKGALVYGGMFLSSYLGDIMMLSADHLQTEEQYRRRRLEWELLRDQAEKEIAVLKQQQKAQNEAIEAARQSQLYTDELYERAKLLHEYFSCERQVNESLYDEMQRIIGALYDQFCSLVRTFCGQVEACWRYETDEYKQQPFIPTDLWSNDNLGVLVGIKLQKALLDMEMAYTQKDERRLEIIKTLSLKALITQGLVKEVDGEALTNWEEARDALLAGKKLEFKWTQQLFDEDYPGHYARKIHELRLTFPTLLPPYKNMRVMLQQTANRLLIEPNIEGAKYLYGLPNTGGEEFIINDRRINQKVVFSQGSDDQGAFPPDTITQEQYRSFEFTSVVSCWQLWIPRPQHSEEIINNLSDVIFKLLYKAKSGDPNFESDVINQLLDPAEETLRATGGKDA